MWAGFLSRKWRRSTLFDKQRNETRRTDVRNTTCGNRLGRPQADAGDRPHGAPGRRRGARPIRRDQRAGDRGRRERARRPGIDFFPLTVNYQEKTYAAGKIPGGFFKREGRPTEKETLTSRLIDRPIRPLFVDGFKHETQVVVTVLSHDMENDPDIVGMVAASAALTLSGLPFLGPIAAARVGVVNGQFVLNPMIDEMANERSRPGGGRHRRRRDDGGVGGQGAAREADAGGGHVRPPRLPAGDRGDHQAGREGRQGAVGLPAARQVQVHGQGQGAGRGRPAQGVCDAGEAEAPRAGRGGERQGQEGAAGGRCRRQRAGAARLRVQGHSSRTSCAATSSAPASASTAAT